MAERLRIGLVGHGRWGQKLLDTLLTLPGIDVQAVCDVGFAGRQQATPRGVPTSTRIFSSAQQMFQAAVPPQIVPPQIVPPQIVPLQIVPPQIGLDAVVIATPSHTHADLTLLALEHGLHVFVEKPMALDVAQAETVVRAARAKGLLLMVGHILHHDAAVSIAYNLLHAGAIGTLSLFLAERSNTKMADAKAAWWELAPHDIAVCSRSFNVDPKWVIVTAQGSSAHAHLAYPTGMARLHVAYGRPRVRRMAWVGDEGALLLQEVAGQGMQLRQARLTSDFRPAQYADMAQSEVWRALDRGVTGSTPVELPSADALRGELSHFAYCTLTGMSPISDGTEGLAVVRVLAAGEQALSLGRRSLVTQPSAQQWEGANAE